jgi:hypothetical protein
LAVVIARNSSFTYKGRAVEIRQVARELGVRYILEGSVRKSGQSVRVTTQLLDAANGVHLWAEGFDRALTDVFAVQDEITSAVASIIEPALGQAELRRALARPSTGMNVWEIYQRGLSSLYQYNADDNATAQIFFGRAREMDPDFAAGYCGSVYRIT